MSTLGDVLYVRGYHDADGEQVDKSLLISVQNPNVLNITQCTYDIP